MRRGPVALLGALVSTAAFSCAGSLQAPEPDPDATSELVASWAEELADEWADRVRRTLEVGNRLRIAGRRQCGDRVAPVLGVERLVRIGSARLSPIFQAYSSRFDLTRAGVTVGVVPDTSPGAQAGLRSGDRLMRIGDRRVRRHTHYWKALREHGDGPLRIELQRGGSESTLELPLVLGCSFGIASSNASDLVPLLSQDDHVIVPAGLLRFVTSSDELAHAIAHSLGHLIHDDASETRLDKEVAADEAGLAMATAAGFDPSAFRSYWSRVALERPWLIAPDPSVPDAREPWHGRIAHRLRRFEQEGP